MRGLAALACVVWAAVGWLSAIGAENAGTPSASDNAAAVEGRLLESLKFLAGDPQEGRGIGTQGLDRAADYIAEQFAAAGLNTKVFGDSPFQRFQMSVDAKLGPREQNYLKLVGPDAKSVELKFDDQFRPLAAGSSGKFNLPIVFVGYGITAKDKDYDDYAGIDVKGKVVLILRKEPQQGNPHGKFGGTGNPTDHASFMRKISNAFEHEAAAIIFVNDSYELDKKASDAKKEWLALTKKVGELQGEFAKQEKPTDEATAKFREAASGPITRLAALQAKLSGDFDELIGFDRAGSGTDRKSIPILFCRRAAVDPMVKQALGKDLAALEDEIDNDGKPRSAALTGWKADGETNVIHRQVEVRNVVGVLEGEGPLADETIVIGAHYDHLGMGGAGSLAPETIAIHNGADDNASGTSALIEVAKQLAAGGKKYRRRIVFIAFTGEERGLVGSARYIRYPRFSLDKTVAMLNMDMVGRLKDEKLIIYGTGTAKVFDTLADELGKKYTFAVSKKPEGFGPSDHSSFYARKIPVIHLFTGTHQDYHRPSDDIDKINLNGMRRVVGLMVDWATSVANADEKPAYLEVKGGAQIVRGGRGPILGVATEANPGDKGGFPISAVVPEGPADKAGLKQGDVIVQLADAKIDAPAQLTEAVSKFKPGDKVPVVVKRGQEELKIEVTLGAPAAALNPRPYFGSIPDIGNEAEGYALSGVAPGGPADAAGIKAGDVIIRVGESKIGGLDDFDSALRKFKGGDKVPVVVLRDKKEVKLEVILGAPRE